MRLGSFPTASASLLPLAVKGFTARYPAIAVSVRSAVRGQLVDMLESREVELALLWDYDWDRLTSSTIELVPVLNDPTALLVSADHPLAGRRSVALEELASEHWVTRADNHPLLDVLLRTTSRAGLEPHIAFEAHDYHEVQAMVAVGLGVALAPRIALTNLRADVRVIAVSPVAPTRRVMLGRLRERRLTPAEDGMREQFHLAARELRRTFAGDRGAVTGHRLGPRPPGA